ncbi:GyrI-like domain-containing protein [Candidatus Thiosymbion oneisti]|uniref:GyrI-like domain-containing protein n=1 Tax=Candidatus Thiosymbion oneisti TaxID=589554 RepID=UPI000B7E85B9|nr:effector binding domain-containing protein [Candidatus Thiosymbion oneisti]
MQEIDSYACVVAGIAIRTNNQEAAQTIPSLWQRFFSEQVPAKIPNPTSDDVFAVYTDFEHKGVSNEGEYTFLIGLPVQDTEQLPDECSAVEIPASNYRRFDVEKGRPEKVFEKWQEIWRMNDLNKSYQCDYERYRSSGEISIHVGTK